MLPKNKKPPNMKKINKNVILCQIMKPWHLSENHHLAGTRLILEIKHVLQNRTFKSIVNIKSRGEKSEMVIVSPVLK